MPIKLYGTNHPLGLLENVIGDFELLQIFVKQVEDQLNKQIQKLDSPDDIYYTNDGHTEIVISNGYNSMDWDLPGVFREYLPSLQRSSLLITIYSFLEQGLNRLCITFKKNKVLTLGLTDISDKGIKRARRYLTKVVGIDFTSMKNLWDDILKIQLLRNSFVHNRGTLKKNDKDFKLISNYIASSPHLTLTGDNTIFLEKTFLSYLVNETNTFFVELLKEVKTTIN